MSLKKPEEPFDWLHPYGDSDDDEAPPEKTPGELACEKKASDFCKAKYPSPAKEVVWASGTSWSEEEERGKKLVWGEADRLFKAMIAATRKQERCFRVMLKRCLKGKKVGP